MGRVSRVVAWAVAVVAAATALYNALAGPFRFNWAGLRISSEEPLRAAVVACLAAAAALWLDLRPNPHADTWWRRVPASTGAAVLAAVTVMFGLWHMTAVASASDPYGYVSQALLWTHGALLQSEPLTTETLLGRGGAPLGYMVATPGTIAPIYPPGLPLLMAAAARLAGDRAVFVVVPLLGGLTVWLTFALGRRVAGEGVGMASALLMAAGPMFVFQLLVPMSDVPATCWWLAALVAASYAARWAGLLAGALASLAVLTRPNLAPLIAPMLFMLLVARQRQQPKVRVLTSFAFGFAPGLAALLIINTHFYGSPLSSGYGRIGDLFRVSWLPINLRSYPSWLLHVYGPFVFAGLAAPAVARGEQRFRRDVQILVLFALTVFGCYAFYLPMDGWPSARFLLPAVPALTILGCIVGRAVTATLPERVRFVCRTLAVTLLASWLVSHADHLGAFAMADADQRYVSVGEYVDRTLPKNAVLLSELHSGPSRLYGHRTSVRWTEIAPGDLGRAIDLLRSRGLLPFIVLDDGEEDSFRERFTNDSELGRLGTPIYEYHGEPAVRVYGVPDGNVGAP